MKADELLILDQDNFSSRVSSFTTSIQGSQAAQQLFLKNPVGNIRKYIFPDSPSAPVAQINQGNRLLLSMLSNPRFMEWSDQFQERLESQARELSPSDNPEERMKMLVASFDRTQIYREVVDAVQEFGDRELLFSLMVKDRDSLQTQIDGSLVGSVAVEVETFVYAVAAIAVAVVAVAVVVVGRPSDLVLSGISRQDLQRVSNIMSDQLTAKAMAARQRGRLSSFSAVRRGMIL